MFESDKGWCPFTTAASRYVVPDMWLVPTVISLVLDGFNVLVKTFYKKDPLKGMQLIFFNVNQIVVII